MLCQSCGKEIADKAIVCYRCGTPTAIPESPKRPDPVPAPGSAAIWHATVLVVVAAVLAWMIWRDASLTEYGGLAAGLVVAEAAIWWLTGRRPKP